MMWITGKEHIVVDVVLLKGHFKEYFVYHLQVMLGHGVS